MKSDMRSSIVVTGANGFIGSALVEALRGRGCQAEPWSRSAAEPFRLEAGRDTQTCRRWQERLIGSDAVIHCAARVHRLGERFPVDAEYRLENADATIALATAAAQAGVRRFVFLSTAKVYGEGAAQAYSESMAPHPHDAYARSKYEAELRLRELAGNHRMDVVILRPPLVYGVGVAGNFARLERLARSRWPLPLAGLKNRRAMIALDNLIDAILCCCWDSRAANKTFNVADESEYTIADIVGTLRDQSGRSRRLWPVPEFAIRALLSLLKGEADVQRLLGDFRLDTSRIRDHLAWRPPLSLADALHRFTRSVS